MITSFIQSDNSNKTAFLSNNQIAGMEDGIKTESTDQQPTESRDESIREHIVLTLLN